MPRPTRENAPGIYHIGAQSVSSRPLFFGNEMRRFFLALLDRTYKRYSMSVIAYCVLSTHYHLLIRTTEEDLSRSLQWLNSRYAETINAEERDRGHLFGARFWSRRIASDDDLLATARYIALNPVKAGMCRRPDEWPWSSYAVLVRGVRRPACLDPAPLLAQFGPRDDVALRRFRAYVEDALSDAA